MCSLCKTRVTVGWAMGEREYSFLSCIAKLLKICCAVSATTDVHYNRAISTELKELIPFRKHAVNSSLISLAFPRFHISVSEHNDLEPVYIPRGPASSRVNYFILRAYTETGVSHSQCRKNSGEVLETMQVNGLEGEK